MFFNGPLGNDEAGPQAAASGGLTALPWCSRPYVGVLGLLEGVWSKCFLFGYWNVWPVAGWAVIIPHPSVGSPLAEELSLMSLPLAGVRPWWLDSPPGLAFALGFYCTGGAVGVRFPACFGWGFVWHHSDPPPSRHDHVLFCYLADCCCLPFFNLIFGLLFHDLVMTFDFALVCLFVSGMWLLFVVIVPYCPHPYSCCTLSLPSPPFRVW